MGIKNKKPRYCKCGHLSHPTHDTPKSFLGIKYDARRGCNGIRKINETTSIPCDCHRFLIETYPSKLDSAITYIAIGAGVLIMIAIVLGIYATNQLLDCNDPSCIKALATKVFTTKEVLSIFFVLGLIGIIYLFGIFYDVFDQHQAWKKREKREHYE